MALGRLSQEQRAEWTARMREALSPHRFQHVLGVAATARELAERFGAEPDRAETAALFHDAAREWPVTRLLEKARQWKIAIDEMARAAPMACLHGPLGAEVARREFGIDDTDVLAAIASHTLGREGMSLLEKVLFVADAIEPHRKAAPYIDELRDLAATDLDRACRRAFEHTFAHLLATGQPIHPQSERARNWFIHMEEEKKDND